MARPHTKADLIAQSKQNYEKLLSLIENLSEVEFNTKFDFSDNEKLKEAHWKRDKNVRDVLIHLHEWHNLLLNWINKNQNGEMTSFLAKPYTFKTIEPMNEEFWQKHQQTSFDKALIMFKNSHEQTMELIKKFSNEELFTNKYFSWTGTTSLGSYCVSATSSHYGWAIKKINKHKRILKS